MTRTFINAVPPCFPLSICFCPCRQCLQCTGSFSLAAAYVQGKQTLNANNAGQRQTHAASSEFLDTGFHLPGFLES